MVVSFNQQTNYQEYNSFQLSSYTSVLLQISVLWSPSYVGTILVEDTCSELCVEDKS